MAITFASITIKGKNNQETSDHSSESERKDNNDNNTDIQNKKKRCREAKLPQVKIDQEQVCPALLPDDALFKGYTDVVIQDIKIKTDNLNYRQETYCSPSLGKTLVHAIT